MKMICRCTHGINVNGKKLIEFCKTCNFLIMNGRCGPDKYVGQTTCKEKPVVDYALLLVDSLHTLSPLFEIYEFSNLLSDVHRPLGVKFSVKNDITTNNNSPVHPDSLPVHFNFNDRQRPRQWNNDNIPEFRLKIDKNKIRQLDEILYNIETTADTHTIKASIDRSVDFLNTILVDAAKDTNGIISPKNPDRNTDFSKPPKREGEPWFTEECRKSRTEYNRERKLYNRTKCRYQYTKLQIASKNYKKTLNLAIRKYQTKIGNDLKDARFKNPKAFWSSFKEKKSNSPLEVNPDELYECFKRNCNTEQDIGNYNFESDSSGHDLCDEILNVDFT